VASMPCYLEENVDAQRGQHAYTRSIEVIRRLNAAGYGTEGGLQLNLVYNPAGPFLPPDQIELEQDYRRELQGRFGISFGHLLTITNMPLGRFGRQLKAENREAEYMRLLEESFNPATVPGLMCRHQVSVGWDGTLYDCDFNLALKLPVNHSAPDHISRIDLIGKDAIKLKEGKQEVFYDASDPVVFSLAVDKEDNLYVGTSPSGRVYKLDEKGKASIFFDSGESYIWDMAFDPAGGLYVATGARGKLFRVDERGKAEEVFDAEDPHIYSLVVDEGGKVYFGTSGSGMVFELEGGKSRVLYDAAQAEIRALALDPEGNLYFGTADVGKESTPQQLAESAKAIISQLLEGQGQSSPGVLSPTSVTFRDEKIAAKNSLYRIDREGDVLEVFSGSGLMILSAGSQQDEVYFGTGNQGKLFKIDSKLNLSQLPDLEVRQVLAMTGGKKGELLLGTAGEARVFEITPGYRREGKFTSRVHDTEFVSKWGKLSWQGDAPGGTEVALCSRSGNTSQPDETWSSWSRPITTSSGGQIESPPARFIQYQALLRSAVGDLSCSLTEVKIAYITSNQPPRIVVLTAGRELPQRRPGPPQPGSPLPPQAKLLPGAIVIRWQASDPNKDKLTYTLHFKGEGEERWKLLEEDIKTQEYTWKTAGVPDGVYYVKLVASDSPSNAPPRALEANKVSSPFLVDNTPPLVADIVVSPGEDRKLKVEAEIRDHSSIVTQASYSVDNQDWVGLLPVDEIFDDRAEQVSFILEELEEGEHTLVIKATDEADNTGAGKTVFSLPLGD